MNKDDILAKSRMENKDKDLVGAEINTKAATISSVVASLWATALFLIQIFVKGEYNLALYAVVFAVGAATFIVKATQLKRKRDIVLAIVYSAATLGISILHLYQMIAG